MDGVAKKLDELVEAGLAINEEYEYGSWSARVGTFLRTAIGTDPAIAHADLADFPGWGDSLAKQIGHLEGLAVLRKSHDEALVPSTAATDVASKKIFLVHGHDAGAKEIVARFLERVGLEPIILHEQPNAGQTVIEKFEAHSDVPFAVVMLTPDDVGASNEAPDQLQGRARQNVVLEMGYFMGRLTRKRVCALFKRGVEIPSDMQGILYVEFHDDGAWRVKLAQELVAAKMTIDLAALLKN